MRHLFLTLLLVFSAAAQAQSILGKWETFDDKTKEKKAVVEIYKTNEVYYAKIVEKLLGDPAAICEKCEEENKNKPIKGLVIIEDIRKNGNKYEGGTILDPKTGEVYTCYLELSDKNTLKVRGFLGFAVFGRTQYWIKKE
jgi:uncharacterized protein (DUF2147 family)